MRVVGELSALGSAFFWAVNSLLVRSQTGRIGAIPLNALQYACAAVFFWGIVVPTGRMALVAEIAPLWLAALMGSALVGMAGGDTMYVRSLGLIGVARAFPVSISGYLLLTFVVAVAFLGETLSLRAIVGGVAVAGGISLVGLATSSGGGAADGGRGWLLGLLMATGAAVCWTIAVSILKLALAEVDVVAANSIRLPTVALALLAIAVGRRDFRPKDYGWRAVSIVGLAGVLGIGVGSLLFLYAVQTAGVARTAVLSSTSPLFAVPLSAVFLGERLTVPIVLGTLLCVVGIVLLT